MEDFAQVVRLTPLISIDLVVRNSENRILVGRRTHEPAKSVFFVPGGRICKNERLEAAFGRISRSELGREINFHASRFIGVFEHFYDTNRLAKPGFGTHYVVLAYEMKVDPASLNLPGDQHSEFAWRTPAELLPSPHVHENTKAYARSFL